MAPVGPACRRDDMRGYGKGVEKAGLAPGVNARSIAAVT